MSEDATQRRTAAQHLASVWNDGKRRVVVALPAVFRHNGQTITKSPTEVIDDPHTIALLEEHDVELIDLEVNGRPKRGQWFPADVDQAKNIDALANELQIMPNLLHAAIEGGKEQDIEAVSKSLAEVVAKAYTEKLRAEIAAAKPATLDAAITAIGEVNDPFAESVAYGATTMLSELRGQSRPSHAPADSGEWKPGDPVKE